MNRIELKIEIENVSQLALTTLQRAPINCTALHYESSSLSIKNVFPLAFPPLLLVPSCASTSPPIALRSLAIASSSSKSKSSEKE